MTQKKTISVIVPCYKVKKHILRVVEGIGPEVSRIYVVDDCCPEGSGDYLEENCRDSRLRIIRHEENQGVGGAVMTGYRAALQDGADIMIKLDGDEQMDASLIPLFIAPILDGTADYTKGNRFFDLERVQQMPPIRLFGNAVLSFLTKLSSGYWHLFDPTNGYTAIDARAAAHLPFHKIAKRYFFETDMLFRLNTIRAVVMDIPIDARYADEESNLKVSSIIGDFLGRHFRNFTKRLFYNYYLRDLSLASLELPVGIALLIFGIVTGGWSWWDSAQNGMQTPAGTVMLAALPILMGLQLVLSFLSYDISSVPTTPISGTLARKAGDTNGGDR